MKERSKYNTNNILKKIPQRRLRRCSACSDITSFSISLPKVPISSMAAVARNWSRQICLTPLALGRLPVRLWTCLQLNLCQPIMPFGHIPKSPSGRMLPHKPIQTPPPCRWQRRSPPSWPDANPKTGLIGRAAIKRSERTR